MSQYWPSGIKSEQDSLDRGLALIRSVLASVELKLATTTFGALVSLVYRSIRIRIRGLDFNARTESEVPTADLRRLDICWSVASPLSMIDNIRGGDFTGRCLLMALDAGEPGRIAAIMAFETMHSSVTGMATIKRTTELLKRTWRVAEIVDRPDSTGLARAATGFRAFFICQFREAAEALRQVESMFRLQCAGRDYELASVHRMLLNSLSWLGEFRELSSCARRFLVDAFDRGNLYAATNLRLGLVNLAWLVDDDPDEAQRMVKEASGRWSSSGFHVQHMDALIADVNRSLYLAEGRTATRILAEQRAALNRSMLLRLQTFRLQVLHFEARCGLVVAGIAKGEERARSLEKARVSAARLMRENVCISPPLVQLLHAGLANQQDDKDAAVRLLKEAATGFDGVDMQVHAVVTRRRLGELRGGDEGQSLVEKANAWMTSQGIKNPARWTAMLAPGFADG